jgi:hypothetical protein
VDAEDAALHPERQGTVAGFGGIFGRDWPQRGVAAPLARPYARTNYKKLGAKPRLFELSRERQ